MRIDALIRMRCFSAAEVQIRELSEVDHMGVGITWKGRSHG